jgi:hypothetical protein
MQYGKLFSRAVAIVRTNPFTWFLGFLAALAGGSSGGSGFNSGGGGGGTVPTPSDDTPVPPEIAGVFEQFQNNAETIGLIALAFVCLLFVLTLIFALLGMAGRGGLIAAAAQIESNGSSTLRQAWAMGTQRFGKLFGLNLVLSLPVLVLLVLFGIVALVAIGPVIASAGSGAAPSDAQAAGLVGIFCIFFPVLCVLGVYSLWSSGMQMFGERAIVLEGLGVRASLSRGWALFRSQISSVLVIALVMFLLSIVIGVIVGLLSLIVILPVFAGVVAAVQTGSEVFGAATIGLILVGTLVIVLIGAIISALYQAFNQVTWTLAFREMTVPPPAAPAVQPVPVSV